MLLTIDTEKNIININAVEFLKNNYKGIIISEPNFRYDRYITGHYNSYALRFFEENFKLDFNNLAKTDFAPHRLFKEYGYFQVIEKSNLFNEYSLFISMNNLIDNKDYYEFKRVYCKSNIEDYECISNINLSGYPEKEYLILSFSRMFSAYFALNNVNMYYKQESLIDMTIDYLNVNHAYTTINNIKYSVNFINDYKFIE